MELGLGGVGRQEGVAASTEAIVMIGDDEEAEKGRVSTAGIVKR